MFIATVRLLHALPMQKMRYMRLASSRDCAHRKSSISSCGKQCTNSKCIPRVEDLRSSTPN